MACHVLVSMVMGDAFLAIEPILERVNGTAQIAHYAMERATMRQEVASVRTRSSSAADWGCRRIAIAIEVNQSNFAECCAGLADLALITMLTFQSIQTRNEDF